MNKVIPIKINKEQEASFKAASHICGIRLGKDRVRDHDHLS